MSGMSGKAIRETLTALGVIASMVFVGMEIRQNTAIARAEARQSLTDNYRELVLARASDPALNAAYLGRFYDNPDDQIRPEEFWMWANLRSLENVFLQVQEGVLEESVFVSYGWTAQTSFRQEKFREWWPPRRARFHPDFVAAFEAEYDLAP